MYKYVAVFRSWAFSSMPDVVDDLLLGLYSAFTWGFREEQVTLNRAIVSGADVLAGSGSLGYIRQYPYTGGDVTFYFSVPSTYPPYEYTLLSVTDLLTDVYREYEGEHVRAWLAACVHLSTLCPSRTKPCRCRTELGLGGLVDMSGFGSSGRASRAHATAPANSPDCTHLPGSDRKQQGHASTTGSTPLEHMCTLLRRAVMNGLETVACMHKHSCCVC